MFYYIFLDPGGSNKKYMISTDKNQDFVEIQMAALIDTTPKDLFQSKLAIPARGVRLHTSYPLDRREQVCHSCGQCAKLFERAGPPAKKCINKHYKRYPSPRAIGASAKPRSGRCNSAHCHALFVLATLSETIEIIFIDAICSNRENCFHQPWCGSQHHFFALFDCLASWWPCPLWSLTLFEWSF